MLLALGLERAFRLGRTGLFRTGNYMILLVLLAASVWLPLSQYFGVGTAQFDSSETMQWLGLWVATLICMLLVWRSLTAGVFLQRVVPVAGIVFVLGAVFPFVVPAFAIEYRAPGDFMRACVPRITKDTLLVTHGSLVHSVNWYLERNDVYLLTPGELYYGLGYPEAQDRYLVGKRLVEFRNRYGGKRPIAVFMNENLDETIGPMMPAWAQKEQYGRFVFWFVPKRHD